MMATRKLALNALFVANHFVLSLAQTQACSSFSNAPVAIQGYSCQNGGTCNLEYDPDDADLDEVCDCQPGYAGTECDISGVSQCGAGRFCANGGVCTPTMCKCPISFAGARCETLLPSAQCSDGHVCLNDGTCTGDPWFPCTCPPEYGGSSCEKYPVRQCQGFNTYCENGGLCSSTGTCICDEGFTGSTCELIDREMIKSKSSENKDSRDRRQRDVLVAVTVLSVFAFLSIAFLVFYMIRRERSGTPIFLVRTET